MEEKKRNKKNPCNYGNFAVLTETRLICKTRENISLRTDVPFQTLCKAVSRHIKEGELGTVSLWGLLKFKLEI